MMQIDNVEQEDIEYICNECDRDFQKFDGQTVLVTGATGLIGHEIVMSLLSYNKFKKKPKIIAVVRNVAKANNLFGKDIENIKYVITDITQKFEIDEKIDYIIHCASSTSSKEFVSSPVEVSKILLLGTMNMLELAKDKNVQGFVYLSSMEVYGHPLTDEPVYEYSGSNIDTMDVRSSYPEGKRMCESLCCSYSTEYQLPIMVACLTQTIGPGVNYDDQRVFAEFCRCAIENRNIILHTTGETKRNYVYLSDAVTAIFKILLNGHPGEKYNIANCNTYCSIKEMAEMVADKCANKSIKVSIELNENKKFGYAPVLHMNLNTDKLEILGWKPNVDLYHMYKRLIISMNNSLGK